MHLPALLLVLAALLLTSCATTVTSIKTDQNQQLSQDKGYVLLGIQTDLSLKAIKITGPQDIFLSYKDLRAGTGYFLLDLPAGLYTIERIDISNYWYTSLLEDSKYWQFEIHPDNINYVGHLEFALGAELVNRSSEAVEFLEDEFPNLLDKQSLHYSGPGEDGFFKLLEQMDRGVQ
ncbi:hypothetical protein [Pseudoalteromonas sp. T1lg23B]|uniref:hypothetical protein n=1 Tax=Pseudoalteromonas sp. T1lg23B TaxID=2077097 RepID=UPI000CF5F466|nr:hypothetical protein [Pseudoalteromonas sp. T1lg23B]